MANRVEVSEIFAQIMAETMRYVEREHGAEVSHHLFFELYSHTFAFLERELSFSAVEKLWEYIADHQLEPLERLMRTRGFEGMEQYWSAVAEQEGGEFEMKRTVDSFKVLIKKCPPCEWFKEKQLPHYERYSEHCKTLYSRVADRCGFTMKYTPRDEQSGICCGLSFTRKPAK